MLEGLRGGLRDAVQRIVRSQGVDEAAVKRLAHDVQVALLQADVGPRLVLGVTRRVTERALGERPPPGLPRKDHVVKILYEEVTSMMGPERRLEVREGGGTRVLMLGVQGSGKTTAAAKLARLLSRQGRRVGVVGADTDRPGALEQLRTMCAPSGAEVYGEEGASGPAGVVERGLERLSGAGLDAVIIDTAGRHSGEEGLIEQMREIAGVARPDVSLLVVDGTAGARCGPQAAAFHAAAPVGGIIVTKLDSSAKGGGAIAAAAATSASVMYVGTGERIDDLEEFSPTRFVGRLLGMGDVRAVLDMARRLEEGGDKERLRRIAGGRMNMEDFYYQLEEVSRAGALGGLLESIPGMSGRMGGDQLEHAEGRMRRWRHIIQSMNAGEKADPGVLNASRVKRVARGSGCSEHDVKELLKAYKQSKGVMKASRGRQMQGALRRMGLGRPPRIYVARGARAGVRLSFEQAAAAAARVSAALPLCAACTGRLFARQLRLRSHRRLGARLGARAPAGGCHVCGGLMDSMGGARRLAGGAAGGYEFSTFLLGVTLPRGMADRDDAVRSRFRLVGSGGIKQAVAAELSAWLARSRGASPSRSSPDLLVTVDLGAGSASARARPVFVRGRYTKRRRGLPQKRPPCRSCRGRGCASCPPLESVESLLSGLLAERFRAGGARITWVGGEDPSSLVSGRGRPFFARVIDPRLRAPRLPRDAPLGRGVRALGLRRAAGPPRPPVRFRSVIEILVRAGPGAGPEALRRVRSVGGSTVAVYDCGRRAEKGVRSARCSRAGPSSFRVTVEADGGLPVKRFVSGDDVFPSVSELAGAECSCERFDFRGVEIVQ